MATVLASLLVTLLTVASSPVSAGAAAAGFSDAHITTVAPADRGIEPADRSDEDGDEADEAPDNCPTELWTVPLEIEGLACVLLLAKDEEAAEEAHAGRRGR